MRVVENWHQVGVMVPLVIGVSVLVTRNTSSREFNVCFNHQLAALKFVSNCGHSVPAVITVYIVYIPLLYECCNSINIRPDGVAGP